MDERFELSSFPETKEWEESVQDFLKSEPGRMVLGKLYRKVADMERSVISTDFISDSGRLTAVEQKGIVRGLLMAIDVLKEVRDEPEQQQSADE